MEYLIALVVFVAAAMAVYHFNPVPASHWNRSLSDTLDESAAAAPLPFWRAMLVALGPVVKYTPVGWLKSIESQLYWCQLAGRWHGWALPEMVAAHLALLGVGFALGVMGGDLMLGAMMTASIPFLFNTLYLRNPARKAGRQFSAELPEFVSMLAAEVGADVALPEAVVRLSRGQGVCAAWFRRAITLKGVGGLFSEGANEGGMRFEARQSGNADLVGLATALDNIKKRGTGARELLSQTATSTATRYATDAQSRAEKVGADIILPMVLFFFAPFVAVLITVIASPLAISLF
jgi:hypothetical protein